MRASDRRSTLLRPARESRHSYTDKPAQLQQHNYVIPEQQVAEPLTQETAAEHPVVIELLAKQQAAYQKVLDDKDRQLGVLVNRNEKLEQRLHAVIGYQAARRETQEAAAVADATSPRRNSVTAQPVSNDTSAARKNDLFKHYYIDAEAESDKYKLLMRHLAVGIYVKQYKTRKVMKHVLQGLVNVVKQLHKYAVALNISEKILSHELLAQQSHADTFLEATLSQEQHNNDLQIEWYTAHICDATDVLTVSIEQIVANKQHVDTIVDSFAERNTQLSAEHRSAMLCTDQTIHRYDTLLQEHATLTNTHNTLQSTHRDAQHQLQQSHHRHAKLQQQIQQLKQDREFMHAKHREMSGTILQMQRMQRQQAAAHDKEQRASVHELRGNSTRPTSAVGRVHSRPQTALARMADTSDHNNNGQDMENVAPTHRFSHNELVRSYSSKKTLHAHKRPMSAAVATTPHTVDDQPGVADNTLQQPVKPTSRPGTAKSGRRPVSSRTQRSIDALVCGFPSAIANLTLTDAFRDRYSLDGKHLTLPNRSQSEQPPGHNQRRLTDLEQREMSIQAIRKVLNVYRRNV